MFSQGSQNAVAQERVGYADGLFQRPRLPHKCLSSRPVNRFAALVNSCYGLQYRLALSATGGACAIGADSRTSIRVEICRVVRQEGRRIRSKTGYPSRFVLKINMIAAE